MIKLNFNYVAFFKPKPSYSKKDIMSKTEIEYYNLISEIIGDKYVIWPQINLGSIVTKKKHIKYKDIYNYQNELNRIVDYGIFDKNTYELKLLIELNGYIHYSDKSKNRDKKVNSICDKCKYKLITIWPEQTKWEIEKEILEALGEIRINICQTNNDQQSIQSYEIKH